MKCLNRLVTVILLTCLFVWTGTALAKSEGSDRGGFTAADGEFYLTEEVFYFFRPGLEFELLDFEIPEDRQPLATFSLKDPMGMPLDREGIYTPGDVDVRMMLTYIPQGEEQKVSYHDRSRDRDGEYTALGDGVDGEPDGQRPHRRLRRGLEPHQIHEPVRQFCGTAE